VNPIVKSMISKMSGILSDTLRDGLWDTESPTDAEVVIKLTKVNGNSYRVKEIEWNKAETTTWCVGTPNSASMECEG
jgi:hypothetical protein